MTDTRPSLSVLGGTALGGLPPDESTRLLGLSKAVALLVYLSLTRPGFRQRRDHLVGLLWPTLDQAHARTALRKTIHAIRSTLGESSVVSFGDEELLLDRDALRCDVVEFNAAIAAGEPGRAIDLYRGDLLPGFHLPDCAEFQYWLDAERSRTLDQAVVAAWTIARDCEGNRQLTEAGRWARIAARHAWNDERTLRRTLVMLDRIGDRAGAISLFEGFARRLRAELDAEPSAETARLVLQLRGREGERRVDG